MCISIVRAKSRPLPKRDFEQYYNNSYTSRQNLATGGKNHSHSGEKSLKSTHYTRRSWRTLHNHNTMLPIKRKALFVKLKALKTHPQFRVQYYVFRIRTRISVISFSVCFQNTPRKTNLSKLFSKSRTILK